MPQRKGRIWCHELDVVGLRFRFKRDGRRALSDMIDKRGSITGIQLIREPDNRADPNAIKVCLPQRILDGKHIGYLRKEAAELLAPLIDKGALEVLACKLEYLREEDDWNTGNMLVNFRDVPKSKPRKARKQAIR